MDRQNVCCSALPHECVWLLNLVQKLRDFEGFRFFLGLEPLRTVFRKIQIHNLDGNAFSTNSLSSFFPILIHQVPGHHQQQLIQTYCVFVENVLVFLIPKIEWGPGPLGNTLQLAREDMIEARPSQPGWRMHPKNTIPQGYQFPYPRSIPSIVHA